MNSRRHWSVLLTSLSAITIIFLFQNCGEGFNTTLDSTKTLTDDNAQNNNSSTDPNDNSNPVNSKAERSYANFANCANTVGVGLNNVVTCLETNGVDLEGLTQQEVNSCAQSLGTSNLIDIAFCLSKKNRVLYGYRQLTQLDVNNCNQAVGPNNIGACLKKNGLVLMLPTTVLQEKIDSCLNNVGLEKVEICLRKNNELPKDAGITQIDIKLCSMIYGETNDDIKTCLDNKEIWPVSLPIAEFETCKSAVGLGGVAGCLRGKRLLGPIVLTQNHVDRCIQAVGTNSAAACLINNRLLPNTVLASEITDCVNRSRNQVPACLAGKNLIPRVLTQAHLDICATLKSENNLEDCLKINGVLNPGITQTLIDNCRTATGDFGKVLYCLRFVQKRLPKVIMTGDILSCERIVGENNIHACLSKNGFDVSTFTQSNINTCITNVGLTKVATCLRVNEFASKIVMNAHVDSCRLHTGGATNLNACLTANGMTVPTGMSQANINTCETAINQNRVPNTMTCMANNEWISPLPTQEFFNACVEYVGVSNTEACLKGHGVLPALTTQAAINECTLANSGQSGNVVNCLHARNYIAPTLVQLLEPSSPFGNRCTSCHGAGGEAVNTFDIYNRTQVLKYVDASFSALNSKSEIMDRINSATQDYRMPPNRNQALNVSQKELVRYWILNGAK